jgi:hypothetical protein
MFCSSAALQQQQQQQQRVTNVSLAFGTYTKACSS